MQTITEPDLTLSDLTEMLRTALEDGVIYCPDCGDTLEPDADRCGNCGSENTLRGHGMI